MASEIPIEFQHLLRYDSTYNVLICRQCKMAVGKQTLKRHLRERHTLTSKERKNLVQALDSVPFVTMENGFPQPLHYSHPVAGLDIHSAYKCKQCDFVTVNKQSMHRHILKSHPEVEACIDRLEGQRWILVKVQRWMATGRGAKLWIVKTAADIVYAVWSRFSRLCTV